ncbi:MAG: hypothetical protein N3E37_04435 [Candidatus Micrarchaeota archaeon]|nr:hypothetical protein [Candidatus Micrarchaeota archaeon]
MEEEIIKVYAKILERYKDIIEEKEQKTVYDLRKMIDPEQQSILKLLEANKIDETDTSKLISLIQNIMTTIRNVYLPISFWLTTEEILELKACEPLQKAILISSIIDRFTQNYYIIKTSDGIKILFSIKESNYLIDITNNQITQITEPVENILKMAEFYFNKYVYVENDTAELE